jgi:Rod binding domain-containing protein
MQIDPLYLSTDNDKITEQVGRGNGEEVLKKACNQFAAIMINQLFKAMRNTLPRDKSFAENTYTEMYDTEISNLGSIQQGGLDSLGRLLYTELRGLSDEI